MKQDEREARFAAACAPASSRRGSLNKGKALIRRPPRSVRAGVEPARESQPRRLRRVGTSPGRARRRRAGAGVSTLPRRRALRGVRPACAPASSRRGSLNETRALAASVGGEVRAGVEPARESQRRSCRTRGVRRRARRRRAGAGVSTMRPQAGLRSVRVRAGVEPARESQLSHRERQALRDKCAPASSRRGSLNEVTSVPREVCMGARRRRAGAGVSTLVSASHAARRARARRRRAGAGVSTRRWSAPRATAHRCAPASSRRGSLNFAHSRSSSAHEPACAPASSRRGSLNGQ